jgi:multimeric flavodoxin WrbA
VRTALGLIASPRLTGNTAVAVQDVLSALSESGISTTELPLSSCRIEAIADCRACIEAGGCDLVDDFDRVMRQLYETDLLVFGTPLYWYGPSGQLKTFIDRWSCLLDREEELFRSRMRGKRIAFVIAQGERGFYEVAACLQMLDWTARYLDMPIVGRIVVVGHARDDYVRDDRQREAVKTVARRLPKAEETELLPPWFHVTYQPGGSLGGTFDP